MTRPLVSILMPGYNAAPFVEETLRAAFAQTWRPLEVIFVDDGSTDDTVARARGFVPQGLHLLTQANGGAASARNQALRTARGDFIQYLDADDLLAPDKIERQLARAAAEPADTVLTGRWGRFTQAPDAAEFRDDNPLCADLSPRAFFLRYGSHDCMMHPAAWLIPRALAAEAGPWDERLSLNDDGEYFARIAAAAGRLAHCADALSYYRSGVPGSLSHQRRRRHLESAHLALTRITDRMLGVEDSPAMRRAAADLCQRFAYDYFPAGPDLVARALTRSRELGGSGLPPLGGRGFRWLARIIGWRTARRLQVLAGKFPAPLPD